jgi:hypothetical protein
MNLPKIDLSSLPDLTTLTGVFGSIRSPGPDDSILILMAYIFEIMPPGGG